MADGVEEGVETLLLFGALKAMLGFAKPPEEEKKEY